MQQHTEAGGRGGSLVLSLEETRMNQIEAQESAEAHSNEMLELLKEISETSYDVDLVKRVDRLLDIILGVD